MSNGRIANPRDILIRPVISEKSYRLADDGKYTFLVAPEANKTEIRQAIEQLFAERPHERVDSGLIRHWFENLNWGQDKIDAEKADMLAHARLGYTTEVSVDWSRAADLFTAVMSRIRGEFLRVGLTAGTSTLEETIQAVRQALEAIAAPTPG